MTKKRTIVLASLLLFALTVSPATGQTWLTGSLEEAQAKAKEAEKILLVDFFVEYG